MFMKHRRTVCAAVAGAVLLLLAGRARAERIAVMEFTNASTVKDLDALGKGLQSMITTDLAQVAAFQLVERSRLADIQAELKLAKSDAVDKATAVKLGKLAGASHLLTGSYTVVGSKMRLDCRVFSVQTGDVLLAANEDGDKDAFFELEKALVKKLVESVGVKLAPKERADMGRVHTADFEAFRKFSQGISLFDEKKYQDALDALRDASKRDKDFKLATLTLGEYERLIGQMRTQAEEIHHSGEEVERLKKNKELSTEADVIEKLFAIASRKGKEDQVARLTALHTLAFNYGLFGTNLGRLGRLRAVEDRFGMERTADAMCASYWSEAPALFPSLPALVSEAFPTPAPESMATFDKDFKELMATLTRRGSDHPANRQKYLLDSIDQARDFLHRLNLDARQTVTLEQKLYDMALRLKPETYWRRDRQAALAKAYREVLDLDRSTAIYTALAAEDDPSMKKEYVLKKMADELELNRDLSQLINKKGAMQPYIREWLLLTLHTRADRGILKRIGTLFPGDKLTPEAAHELGRLRTFPSSRHGGPSSGMSVEGPVLVGAQPTWLLGGASSFRTGARTDIRHTDELRWYLDKPPREPREAHGIAIVDGQPRKEVSAKFTVSFAPPADWYPPRAPSPARGGGAEPERVDGRPDVSFLLGVRDIDAPKQQNPQTKKSELTRPMRGYAVVLKPGAVQLVEVTELSRAMFDRKGELGLKVLGEQKASLDGKSVPVQVDVQGTKVKVSAGGKSLSFDLPSAPSGFYGFLFQGLGYASVGALSVAGRQGALGAGSKK